MLENNLNASDNSKWYAALSGFRIGRSLENTCPVRTLVVLSSLNKIDIESEAFIAFKELRDQPDMDSCYPVTEKSLYKY